MRKYIVALVLLITFGLAMGATMFNRTVAEALVRAEGYSYPIPPSEPAPTYTAASDHAGDHR
jgi:hypothetical protein